MTNGAVVFELAGKQLHTDKINVTDDERVIVDVHRGMLSDPDWLIPMSTAQKTYRGVYYGMTATALLEDVHFDSLANWLNRHRPAVLLTKPVRGELGDYTIDGIDVSHKSMSGPTDTGVNWNALKAAKASEGETPLWSSETPMIIVSSQHKDSTFDWTNSKGETSKGRVVYPAPKNPPGSLRPTLVSWGLTDEAEVIGFWPHLPTFEEVWDVVGYLFSKGVPAYLFDLVYLPTNLAVGDKGVIHSKARPGQYLLPLDLLKDIPLGANNRAALIKKATIEELMNASRALDLWTPFPIWPVLYAGERPPDLYLSLRADFDRRFSPAGAW